MPWWKSVKTVEQPAPLYSYEPLADESRGLRIIKLKPGALGDPLECSLIQVDSAERGPRSSVPYCCLSYCWGDPTLSQTLFCDGRALPITESLYSALQRLRHAVEIKHVWADAACIQQVNHKEKSAQVSAMRDIYSDAESVAVWLGEHADKSELAVQFVNKSAAFWEDNGVPTGATTATGEADPFQHSKTFTSPRVKALLSLVRRPWFSRVWIVQEVAVAADRTFMQIGPDQMKWSDFSSMCSWAATSGIAVYAAARLEKPLLIAEAKISDATGSSTPAQRSSLLHLAVRHRQFDATDAKDKLYALRGLASDLNDLQRGEFRVDYNMSTHEIYASLATHYILMNQLDILSVPRGKHHPHEQPSWVPQWDEDTSARPVFDTDHAKWQSWCAAGKSIPSVDSSRLPHVVGLEGFLIDSIVEIGRPWTRQDAASLDYTPSSIASIYDAVRQQIITTAQWEKLSKADTDQTYTPTEEKCRDVFWQIMVAGCIDAEQYAQRQREFEAAQKLYRRHRALHRLGIDRTLGTFAMGVIVVHMLYLCAVKLGYGDANSLVPKDFNLQTAISAASSGRRMCRTMRGYLGLVPEFAEVGDEIGLICGFKAPIVLRKAERLVEKGLERELVGDAYIHGMMRGELFRQEDCGRIWLR